MSPFACRTCGSAPCTNPGFCRLCREADQKHKPEAAQLPANWHRMSLGGLWHALNDPKRHGTPEVIVDAIVRAVRARGADALKEPATIDRLSTCDEAAKALINARLSKLGVQHG